MLLKITPEEDAARFLTELLARILDKCSEFVIVPSKGVKFGNIPNYMFTRSLLDDEDSREQYDRVFARIIACEFLPLPFANQYFSSWTENYAAFVERKILSTPPSDLLADAKGSLLGRGGFFYEAMALDGYNYDGFVTVEPGDIVIDAGAFIGDTAWNLAVNHLQGKGKIYAFEPQPSTFDLLQRNVKNIETVETINSGLGDEVGELRFREAGGSACFDPNGNLVVKVTTLDSFVKEKNLPRVDFIKADIEGAECAMLLGAAETIRKFRPKMALCIYHRASTDHWLVPETLLSICPNYRFHLKQYRDNHLETVLFCEPTEKPIDRAFDRERLRAFSELYRKTQLQLLKKTNKPQIANVASVAAKLTGQRFSWKFDSYNAWARAPLSFSENSYYQINPYGSDRFAVELHFRKLDEYAEDTRRTIRGLFDELKKHYASFTFTSRANDIFGGFTVRREPDADVSEAVGHEFARLIAETLPFLEKHGLICGRNAIDSVRDRFAKAINAS